MKRFVALIAAAILVSLLLVIPTSPASADTGVCAGPGSANVTNGLYYPILGPKRTGPFTLNIAPPGTCVNGVVTQKGLSVGGRVNGWCGLSSGAGTASGDGTPTENFWFIDIGGVLIVGGHITGVAVVVPMDVYDVFPGDSCMPDDPTGLNNFLIAGVVVKNHVVPQSEPLGKPLFPPALALPEPAVLPAALIRPY